MEAVDQLGKFSALAADSVNQTKEALVQNSRISDRCCSHWLTRGRSLTRSLGMFATYPFAQGHVGQMVPR